MFMCRSFANVAGNCPIECLVKYEENWKLRTRVDRGDGRSSHPTRMSCDKQLLSKYPLIGR